MRALARATHILRSSRVEPGTLRRALEAACIPGIRGLAIVEGPAQRPVVAWPEGFAPATDDPQRWAAPIDRGHLVAVGPEVHDEPLSDFLEALAALIYHFRQTLERVERSRHGVRNLIEHFPVAVAGYRHGGIEYANTAWTVLTGGVVTGQSMVGWVLEQDQDRAARAILQGLPEGVVVRMAYDPSRWVALEATTFTAGDGQQSGVIIARETTDRRAVRAEQAIADRLDVAQWLTAGVAHELNNPLTALMANLEIALQRLDVSAPEEAWAKDLRNDVDDTYEAAERMRQSIRDLRDLGRAPGHDSEAVDIRRVVDTALGLTRRLLGHRCHVERYYDEVPPVMGRVDGLGQVMVAVIKNAAEAFARQDERSGLPSVERPSHTLEIWIHRRGTEVSVKIADDGPGVAPEMERGLFEPFVGHGYGLGLAQARQMLEALGGTIRYAPRNGPGSLFHIALPVAEPHEVVLPSEPDLRPPTLGRVLVVDDEEMIGRAVQRMLAPDYEVVAATEGATGLRLLVENPSWDLILLDLMMPGIGGVDVYEEIERQLPHLLPRVVVVTGGIVTQQAHEFLERTGCTTLSKPFEKVDLIKEIQRPGTH